MWTRVLNCVRNLGLARVTVPVDDLRPRAKNVQVTLDAVDDIRLCKSLFDKWMTELDKVPRNSDKREQKMRLYLGRLKERAGLCSDKTDEILRYHVQFASRMAQQIDDASKSYNHYLKFDGPLAETTKLAKSISKASSLLSTNIERMTNELKLFVSFLVEVQVMVKKKKYESRITTIFVISSPSISGTARHHPDPKIRGSRLANTALGQAASEVFKVDSEPQGKRSKSLDSVILFLKGVVPKEAKNARKKLELSDEAIKVMKHMRAGRRVTLYGSDAAAIVEGWRDVAKQYQLALEKK